MAKDNNQNLLDSTYDELTEFEDFFKKHWMNIIIAGLVIVFLIVAGIQAKAWFDRYNSKAGAALSSAKTIEEIEAVLRTYPRHKTADYVRLRLAALYFETKNFEKASGILTELAKKTNIKELAAQAELNLAAILLQNGKINEAAEKYSAIGENQKFPANYRIEAKASAAMLYWNLGKTALAKTTLEINNPAEINFANSNPNYQRAKAIISSM